MGTALVMACPAGMMLCHNAVWLKHIECQADLDTAGQFWHASSPVDASVNQLLRLHIIGHLPLKVHAPLAVAGACKVLGAAGYEADCESAAKESQGALLPEAVDERYDPFAAVHSLPQWPAPEEHVLRLSS